MALTMEDCFDISCKYKGIFAKDSSGIWQRYYYNECHDSFNFIGGAVGHQVDILIR